MATDHMKEMAAQARKDGYLVIELDEGGITLQALITFAQDIFPNHSLDDLAITEAGDNEIVISARTGVSSTAN